MGTPIRTKHPTKKDCWFSNRLDARWSIFFDCLNVQWEYEPAAYRVGAFGWYIPTFWLHEFGMWAVVQRSEPTEEDIAKLEAVISQQRETQGAQSVGVFLGEMPRERATRVPILGTAGALRPTANKRLDRVPQLRSLFGSAHNNAYTGASGWGEQLACPVCGDRCVTIGQPEIEDSSAQAKEWAGRGGALYVPMSCRVGHSWEVRFGEHDDHTFLAITNPMQKIMDVGAMWSQNKPEAIADAFERAYHFAFDAEEFPELSEKNLNFLANPLLQLENVLVTHRKDGSGMIHLVARNGRPVCNAERNESQWETRRANVDVKEVCSNCRKKTLDRKTYADKFGMNDELKAMVS